MKSILDERFQFLDTLARLGSKIVVKDDETGTDSLTAWKWERDGLAVVTIDQLCITTVWYAGQIVASNSPVSPKPVDNLLWNEILEKHRAEIESEKAKIQRQQVGQAVFA
ncbi:MAG: hypothetical protein ABIG63_11500 [Chloroflexota bacterium]